MLNRIILSLALLISSLAFGQTKPTFSINSGIALPIGNFGANDESAKNGFAKSGPQVNLGINWPLNKKFGIELMAHGQLNPLDTRGLANKFNGQSFYSPVAVGYSPGSVELIGMPGSPVTNWKFEKASWQTAGLLVGPTINLPINDKLSFTGKVMAGAMYVVKPEIEGRAELNPGYAQFSQIKQDAVAFSYSANAGLKWKITDRISLTAGVSYFAVPEATFKKVHTIYGEYGTGGFGTENFESYTIKQKISTLNFNIGIIIRL